MNATWQVKALALFGRDHISHSRISHTDMLPRLAAPNAFAADRPSGILSHGYIRMRDQVRHVNRVP
jgi:hypothetical protein